MDDVDHMVRETFEHWPGPWYDADWKPTETAPRHVQEARFGPWKRCFAWLPVSFKEVRDGSVGWAWLRTVERRRVNPPAWFLNGVVFDTSFHQYRPTRKALGDQP